MTLWVYFVWPEFQEKWIRKQGKKVLVKTRNPLVYGRMRARSREDLREKILHILAIAGVDDRAVEFSCGEYIDTGRSSLRTPASDARSTEPRSEPSSFRGDQCQ